MESSAAKTVLKPSKKPYSEIKSKCGHEIRNIKLTGKTISLSHSFEPNNEFLALQKRYLQSNRTFIDSDFEIKDKCVLKRPLEITTSATLEVKRLDEKGKENLRQNVVKTRRSKRFLTFYDYQDLIKILPGGVGSVCQNFEAKYFGGFLVKLFFKDRWYDVVVDDRLPCDESGELIHQKPFNKTEFWPCIIEKAIAKLLGGYHRACYIKEFEFIHMVHGGFIQKISLEDEIIPYSLGETLKNVVINDNILMIDGFLMNVEKDIKKIGCEENLRNSFEFLIFHKSLKDCVKSCYQNDVEDNSIRVFENLVEKEFTFQLDGDFVKDCYQVWANQSVEIIKKDSIKSMERDFGTGFFFLKPGRYLCLNARNIVYARKKRTIPEIEQKIAETIESRFHNDSFSNFFMKNRMQLENGSILNFEGKWVQERGQAGGCSVEKSEKINGLTTGLAHNPQFMFDLGDINEKFVFEKKEYRLRIHMFKLQKYNNHGTGVAVYKFPLGKAPSGNVVCQDYVHANEPFLISKMKQDVNQVVLEKETVGDGSYLVIPFGRASDSGSFLIRIEYCGYQTRVEEKFEQKMVLTKGRHTLF